MINQRHFASIPFLVVLFLCMPILAASRLHSPGFAGDSPEIEEWLQAHNSFRLRHGVPGVTWSPALAQSAKKWADTCPSRHSDAPYGENIAYATNPRSAGEIVATWYGEKARYDYARPGYRPETGHFTQVVWKDSARIGCASKKNCSGSWENIWVCQYDPPGNVRGRFAVNVFPAGPRTASPAE